MSDGPSISYKAAGANATDEYGNLDTVEFINVAKDDALAYPQIVHRTYPSTVNARMEGTIRPFIEKSLAVNNTLLDIFNDRLGLPQGTLAKKHLREEPSGSESRCIKNPPKPAATEPKTAIGAHTDFGSLVSRDRPSVRGGHGMSDGVSVISPSFTTVSGACR